MISFGMWIPSRRKKNDSVTFNQPIRYIEVDAYSHFYKENKDRLYAYLLRMTGDHHMACDLVQESFVRYLGRYGKKGAIRSLLYTIARHAALDAFRKKALERIEEGAPEEVDNDPEQQVIAREGFDHMMAAIQRLSSLDRELISLVATGDLTYREIGKILNLSEGNVKVKVHRARTRLREILTVGG